MGKLHELLAVEGDLKSAAQKARSKILNIFTDGVSRLVGRSITYQVNEGEDERPPEMTELATTAWVELDQFWASYTPWVDAVLQKETTNQVAKADLTIDGQVLAYGLPATALLNLEAKLAELVSVYETIPVSDPTERWAWDTGQEHYVSAEKQTAITKKASRVIVLYEATPEHPAQTQLHTEDVRIGLRAVTLHSGMMSPREKRERLERVTGLLRAIKEARQRANDVEVSPLAVGETLRAYIEQS